MSEIPANPKSKFEKKKPNEKQTLNKIKEFQQEAFLGIHRSTSKFPKYICNNDDESSTFNFLVMMNQHKENAVIRN